MVIPKIYSFDVFDTVITRTTALPYGIFALMQKELFGLEKYSGISEDFKRNFPSIRIHAEELARYCVQRGGIEDVTFDEIYEYVAMRCDLSDDELKQIKELEIEIELRNVHGISENVEKIKKYLAEKKRVVFISDMYLPKDVIRQMLSAADSILADVPLYVSNEYRKIKYTGNLYRVVREKENVEYSEWVHCGDNPRGDVAGAKRVGILTEQYCFPEFMKVEKEALERREFDADVQLVVGAARNARLGCGKNSAYRIGTSIGGPILVSYTEWILQKCIMKGIKRLYFIARDGYILKDIADVIIQKKNIDIETYYLYGSRSAWRMPSFDENSDLSELLEWSHINRIDTVKKLADILQVEVEDCYKYMPKAYKGIKYLTPIIRQQVIDSLNCNNFKQFLKEKHSENKRLTIQYLKKEICCDDNNFAFVELGGSGYTQECLAKLIHDFYDKPILTFYFKMDMLRKSKDCDFMTFYPSKFKEHILIEVLCHAPHGQTSGYKIQKTNENVFPILETYEDTALAEHGINEYIEGIHSFVKEKYFDFNGYAAFSIGLEYVDYLYAYLSNTDDVEILDFIGDMPNSVTGREKKSVGFAPKLTDRDIRNIFWGDRLDVDKYYQGTSLTYSMRRCNQRQRKKIEWYKKNYNSALGKIYRKVIIGARHDKIEDIPKELINKDIVIYAAGYRGRMIYEMFRKKNEQSKILWVDKNWKEKAEQGLPVKSPEAILMAKYDYVIITIEDNTISEQVKKYLKGIGVEEKSIIRL